MRQIDWGAAQVQLQGKVTANDEKIVELLAAGRSTPEIAKTLGTNRSAIWRRVQKIKMQLLA